MSMAEHGMKNTLAETIGLLLAMWIFVNVLSELTENLLRKFGCINLSHREQVISLFSKVRYNVI